MTKCKTRLARRLRILIIRIIKLLPKDKGIKKKKISMPVNTVMNELVLRFTITTSESRSVLGNFKLTNIPKLLMKRFKLIPKSNRMKKLVRSRYPANKNIRRLIKMIGRTTKMFKLILLLMISLIGTGRLFKIQRLFFSREMLTPVVQERTTEKPKIKQMKDWLVKFSKPIAVSKLSIL